MAMREASGGREDRGEERRGGERVLIERKQVGFVGATVFKKDYP